MDLSTTYLGMTLKNPIVPSASPLTGKLDTVRQLEDAGAAAIVLPSLFEEQINQESHQLDHFLNYGSESYGEALSYFPEPDDYNTGPDAYLNHITDTKKAVDIPVIASLNGVSTGGWIEYARYMEEAGADALELNIYYIPTDLAMSGQDVEAMYVDVVQSVTQSVGLPVAVKLSPYFSAMAHMAARLQKVGAQALVLFNRFYQPDLDIEGLDVVPHLVLSQSHELRLPLRWVALLYGRVPLDFAITSGIHHYEDVIKALMAGANITMMASALLKLGVGRIEVILQALTAWLEAHDYTSVQQMQGSMSQQHVSEPAAFERANYMKVLQSWRPDPTGRHF